MPANSTPNIIIIGAGIGGLSTALALLRAGFQVTVLEQNTQLSEVGAGLSLSPNANHALNYLGLESALASMGNSPASAGVQHYQTGELLVDVSNDLNPKQQYGADYLMVHRADLHQALIDAVVNISADCIRLGQSFTLYKNEGARVTAQFADNSVVHGDVLVGCDGIHSQVRSQMHGPQAARFTGYIAWRGLVPVDRLDLKVVRPESAICIGPGKTCTRYLIQSRNVVNYVAAAKRSGWEVESWSVRSPVSELLDEFHDFHDDIRAILGATPADACFKWALFDRDPLPHWIDGRVVLSGDAAHPMLPFLGQGAAMAIEDAVILQRALSDFKNIDEALRSYQIARLERTRFVTLESRANIKRMQAPNPDAYDRQAHRNEAALGLFDYNPATAAI